MAKIITRPTEKVCKLDKYDPAGTETVTIRQGTQQAHEAMSELYSEVSRILRPVGEADRPIEMRTRVSQAEVMRRAAFLTLIGSTLQIEDEVASDNPGDPPKIIVRPAFNFRTAPNGRSYLDMTESDFMVKGWGRLPPEVCDEIYSKVIEVNAAWGPSGE